MVLKLIGDNPSGPFAPILSNTPVKLQGMLCNLFPTKYFECLLMHFCFSALVSELYVLLSKIFSKLCYKCYWMKPLILMHVDDK